MIFLGSKLTNNNDKSPLVEGEIIFEKEARSFSGATAYIRLEDVSLMDAPSKVISEQVITDVSYRADTGSRLKFALYGEIPNKRARYAVRVHIDVDGDGRVSIGDFITMESYPVLTFGHPNYVTVRVREVK